MGALGSKCGSDEMPTPPRGPSAPAHDPKKQPTLPSSLSPSPALPSSSPIAISAHATASPATPTPAIQQQPYTPPQSVIVPSSSPLPSPPPAADTSLALASSPSGSSNDDFTPPPPAAAIMMNIDRWPALASKLTELQANRGRLFEELTRKYADRPVDGPSSSAGATTTTTSTNLELLTRPAMYELAGADHARAAVGLGRAASKVEEVERQMAATDLYWQVGQMHACGMKLDSKEMDWVGYDRS
jgi:hypothetical protein